MNIEEKHEDLVKKLTKDPKEIYDTMTCERLSRLKTVFDSCIGASEELDVTKKHVIYNKELKERIVDSDSEESFDTDKQNHAFNQLTIEGVDLLHASVGIFGEGGEILQAIDKHVFHGEALDIENIREELGDIEFYLRQLRLALNIDRDELLEENISKLEKRYEGGYSDQKAQIRADKNEVEDFSNFNREEIKVEEVQPIISITD